MSKREIVDSYVRGEIDRRGFIRGLTALGVSAGAAATYAFNFAPSTAASAGNNGFVVRAGQQDARYGTAITLESLLQGLQLAFAELAATLSALAAGLAAFSAQDFTAAGLPADTADLLTKMQQQLADQQDALKALGLANAAGTGTTAASSAPGTPQAFLDQLATQFDQQASALAAIAPALQDGEARQTVTNIGFVTSRQAAIVHYLAGSDPIPSAFEEPKLP